VPSTPLTASTSSDLTAHNASHVPSHNVASPLSPSDPASRQNLLQQALHTPDNTPAFTSIDSMLAYLSAASNESASFAASLAAADSSHS